MLTVLYSIDLLHASTSNRSPILTALASPCVKLRRSCFPGRCFEFSPLLPYEELILPDPNLLPISSEAWRMLVKAWKATRRILDDVPKLCTFTCHHYALEPIPPDHVIHDTFAANALGSADPTLDEACNLAASIHLRVTDPERSIPFHDIANQSDAHAIHDCLSMRMKSSWLELREIAPYLYTWM